MPPPRRKKLTHSVSNPEDQECTPLPSGPPPQKPPRTFAYDIYLANKPIAQQDRWKKKRSLSKPRINYPKPKVNIRRSSSLYVKTSVKTNEKSKLKKTISTDVTQPNRIRRPSWAPPAPPIAKKDVSPYAVSKVKPSLLECMTSHIADFQHVYETLPCRQSQFFVDLTTTTVTPKRKSNIRRSHSHESIYSSPVDIENKHVS